MAEVISFQTGRLAIPYKPEAAQGVTPEGIRSSCRETYDPAIVPAGASVLIGAVDVQDNRLEGEISAWGLVEVERDDASQLKGWGSHEFRGLMHEGRWFRLRRWAMEYRRFHGDPGTPELWEQLAEFMETPRPHESGPLLRPVKIGIDVGGHYGPQVAEFCQARGLGYQPLKGLAAATFRGRPGAAKRDRRHPGKLRTRRADVGMRERGQGIVFQSHAPEHRRGGAAPVCLADG